ncbi:hypothetical protein P20652_3071 [Pseudoalteromonas sp. BSi20652]|nr:hypothetical protein P20652_3071 [Pseudoalteromonas sp. BSi20652]
MLVFIDYSTFFLCFWSFQCSSFFYHFELSTHYVIAILTVALSYLYCAEIFSAYRSWRAGKFRDMIFTAWSALFLAICLLCFLLCLFLSLRSHFRELA